jgi:hypothetical protein
MTIKANKAAVSWMLRCGKLETELRAAKREKRVAMKLLKGQMLNDSRIIGELKRDKREVWKALSASCGHEENGACLEQCGCPKCQRSTCPLLNKGGVK